VQPTRRQEKPAHFNSKKSLRCQQRACQTGIKLQLPAPASLRQKESAVAGDEHANGCLCCTFRRELLAVQTLQLLLMKCETRLSMHAGMSTSELHSTQ
jgi:hypothetical protein